MRGHFSRIGRFLLGRDNAARIREDLSWFAIAIRVQAGTIQGAVLEQASGRPLARTVVRLDPVPKSGGGKVQPLATRAGRSGQFVFPAVVPGIYVLAAVREGYFPVAYGQRLPTGRGNTHSGHR